MVWFTSEISLQYLKELGSKSLKICGAPFVYQVMYSPSMKDSSFWHIPKLRQSLPERKTFESPRFEDQTPTVHQVAFCNMFLLLGVTPSLMLSNIGKILFENKSLWL